MPTVSIVRSQDDDVRGAVRKAVALSEGFESIQWEAATVLIKPNSVNPSKSGTGNVTDSRVIEAVTGLVLERNPRRVVIGEGSSVGYDFPYRMDSMDCMKAAGVLDVAKRFSIEVVDLNRDEQVEIKLPDAFVMERFCVAKTAWDADVILCLPVIKTHVRTGITCGLKNMKGVLPGKEKKRTHQSGLDRGIVDLNRAVKPHFTVVDGITGVQGTHTNVSDKVPLNLILAGNDVVAIDTVCAAVAGFDPRDILHVQLAAEAGLGVAELHHIEVRGEQVEAIARPFIPYLEAAKDLYSGATIIEKDTCTGCLGELVSTVIYLKKARFSDKLAKLTVVMGRPDSLPSLRDTPVVVGQCAREYRNVGLFVTGCPPHGIEITNGACEVLGIDKHIVHRAIKELHDAGKGTSA